MTINTSQILSLLFFALMIPNYYCSAQINLVPNPSFEEYTNCPNSGNRVVYLKDWDLDFNTSDFYHECSTISYSIPNNVYGNQCASTGNAYSGLYPYTFVLQADRREYIGGKLSDTLTIGIKYYVTFKVSLAEISPCSINNFGMKFLTENLIDSNAYTPYILLPPVYVDNIAQVTHSSIISNSVEWTIIRGSFIADSSYINFLIGNFYSIPNIDSIVQPSWPTCQSYYYLDDVCISTDSLFCENIKNQIINITADSTIILQNSCIDFNIQTIINYSNYEWHFNGGFPTTSNQMNPTNVCYQNSGIYDVTFIGHKQGGCTDTLNLPNFIHVDTTTSTIDYYTITKNPEIVFSDNTIKVTNFNNIIEFNIYDIVGKEISSGQLISENSIDCNNLIAGSYILLINNSSIKPFKFIINPKSN